MQWRSISLWHGFRESLRSTIDQIPTFAEQIVDLLDPFGIEKAHIEGESLGGWVGLWFALHYPDRLGKLILNTTAGIRFDPGTIQERPAEGRQLLRQRSMEAINNPYSRNDSKKVGVADGISGSCNR